MSVSRQKLNALVDNIVPLLPYTTNAECEALFEKLCDFGSHVLRRREERQWLQRSPITALLSLPRIRKRQRPDEQPEDEHMTTADTKRAAAVVVVDYVAGLPSKHLVHDEDGGSNAANGVLVEEEDVRVRDVSLVAGLDLKPDGLSDIVDDDVLHVVEVFGDAQKPAERVEVLQLLAVEKPRVPIIRLRLTKGQENENEALHECSVCGKNYRNELVCDLCTQDFTWCCAGYEREPRPNPIHAETGQEIGLSAFCSDCIEQQEFRSGVPMTAANVLAQEDDYDALVRYFDAHSNLQWVPIAGDGFCMFSVVWNALMPVMPVTESGILAHDPGFLGFIKRVAAKALELLEVRDMGDMDRSVRVECLRVWKLLQQKPVLVAQNWESPALDYAWPAIVECLNSSSGEERFRIRIYRLKADRTDLYNIQNVPDFPNGNDDDGDVDGDDVNRTISVLQWNDIASHYDFIKDLT